MDFGRRRKVREGLEGDCPAFLDGDLSAFGELELWLGRQLGVRQQRRAERDWGVLIHVFETGEVAKLLDVQLLLLLLLGLAVAGEGFGRGEGAVEDAGRCSWRKRRRAW